jgi:nitrilase
MPLARTALYSLGEDLHIAVWPGNRYNTIDITPFTAKEGRSFVIAVSGLMRKTDIPEDIPHRDLILKNAPEILADGGSCASAPDGSWLVEPFTHEEKLIITQIDHKLIRRERQNFDAVGHYSRPDVLQLQLKRQRQQTMVVNEN